MAFNSIEYLSFLLIVVLAYRILPFKIGLALLLASSYYFYSCWNQYYLILILASTLVDFFCAQKIEASSNKKFYLCISLLSNLGILFTFKYLGFFTEITQSIVQLLGGSLELPSLQLLLPVGISFYTLQTMSYSIDVYQGKIKAEQHFIRFAIYVAFFPQLVAGPIERASKIIPQFFYKQIPTYEDYLSGIQLITWGIFKKVVIADRLSIYVSWAFNNPEQMNNSTLAMAGFLANLLIYADFSAYADIAIGSAKCLGIKLSPNFNLPMFSKNMPDFWRRWHISLHNWFIDYVYLPSGGSRVNYLKFIVNVFLIFILSGLWHGAAWNFVLWSLFHFLLILIHIHVIKLGKALNFTWGKSTVLVCLGIILVHIQRDLSMYLFFIPDISVSLNIYLNFFTEPWTIDRSILGPSHLAGFVLAISFTSLMLVAEALHIRKKWDQRLKEMSVFMRWPIYYSIIFSIFIFGIETNNPFIYFQF